MMKIQEFIRKLRRLLWWPWHWNVCWSVEFADAGREHWTRRVCKYLYAGGSRPGDFDWWRYKPMNEEDLRDYDLEEVRDLLAEAAANIEEELARLEQAATPTQETMNIEFTI
jgi:hypothetical protein